MPPVPVCRLEACGVWFRNKIGDAGMTEFSRQIASGSLGSLRQLYLEFNQIGDAGISSLATAVRSGALPQLNRLVLSENAIGDIGISALASACANGALPKCTSLHMGGNPASKEATQTVKDAIASRK